MSWISCTSTCDLTLTYFPYDLRPFAFCSTHGHLLEMKGPRCAPELLRETNISEQDFNQVFSMVNSTRPIRQGETVHHRAEHLQNFPFVRYLDIYIHRRPGNLHYQGTLMKCTEIVETEGKNPNEEIDHTNVHKR